MARHAAVAMQTLYEKVRHKRIQFMRSVRDTQSKRYKTSDFKKVIKQAISKSDFQEE